MAKSLSFLFLIFLSSWVWADNHQQQDTQSPTSIMSEVVKQKDDTGLTELQLKDKHRITFYMALPLLILILLTTSLGVAMGVFGKRHLYLWHMVSAGLTVTLALAHAVVGIVWFYPF